MKVVVSVGGSVLAPDLEADRVADYAAAIQSLDADGHTLGTVVGGGPTARDYIESAIKRLKRSRTTVKNAF